MQPPRRNRMGIKSSELWNWPVEDIRKMTGPLALQEYLQEIVRYNSANIEKVIECPPSVDLSAWKYEQTRQFVLELNLLVTSLKGVCTKEVCPTMKGSIESQFLCAAHKVPTSCSAMEYMFHNLDQSTSTLLSLKNFPNRSIPLESKSLETIVRRLYRVFSHCYHLHRQVFQEFERDMHLCDRFTAFNIKYAIMDQTIVNIPKRK